MFNFPVVSLPKLNIFDNEGSKMLRQLVSLVLPLIVTVVVPFFLVGRLQPLSIKYQPILPYLQIPLGLLLFVLGLSFLAVTIRLFVSVGKGTLAPWDPTRKLVVQGVYRYTRNPMISGVLLMLLGESIALGSWELLCWFLAVVVVNTIYFKTSEEPGLVKRFGEDYERYRRFVPMWIPRLKPWDPKETDVGPDTSRSGQRNK